MTFIILVIFLVYIALAIRYRFYPFGRVFKNIKSKKGFNSLMILLGSSLGVGNIVGVGVAIYIAGPGVLFWMIVSAFFSATTNFLEVFVSKQKCSKDSYGPIPYINYKPMAFCYTVVMIITSLFIGNLCQINSIMIALNGVSSLLIAVVIAFLFFLSTKKYETISKVLNFIMPFACILYLGLCLFIIFIQRANFGEALILIYKCAFYPKAYLGVPLYFVFNQGVLFAIFSNEAGNGSSAMAFKDNYDDTPKNLGIVSSMGPIIDTALICVLSGLVILTSPIYSELKYLNFSPDNYIYVLEVFKDHFGIFGTFLMTFLIIIFSFATLISWFYYGVLGIKELVISYYFYQAFYIFIIFVSAFTKLTFLMNFTNILNIILLIINLFFLCRFCFTTKQSMIK